MRDWFTDAATERGLAVETDRNGNLWAWWLPTGDFTDAHDAFVTGSHLDSVPGGGAFDGPLGIVSAFCAIDLVRDRGIRSRRPVAVVAFAEEEGARFGVACIGSKLMTGVLAREHALALTDVDGVTMGDAMAAAGVNTGNAGRDDEALRRIGMFVELHIEQGRQLVDLESPIGIARGIWPHGRWRFSFIGKADHAGTTQLDDRRDPMLCFAEAALSARLQAQQYGGLATFARVNVEPNATNGIASRVDAWLDARAPDQGTLDKMLIGVAERVGRRASVEQVESVLVNESLTPAVEFSDDVRAHLRGVLGDVPEIPTGAGHDAGVLAARVPTGMLFVRNPTGTSHSADEFAERADCITGVEALADVMADWLCR
jgi:beta-ureidopropionase / N-carbamoyl-L-amino-acid hydrolase